ncbi:MAG: prepilin-type N-terminal cleavage/methylation domain-containing protein [bacterium]
MNKGFTLIEVVVSMAIMLPMLILIFNLVPGITRLHHRAHGMTISSQLGCQLMEDIVRQSRRTIVDFNQDFSEFATPFETPFTQFKRIVTDSKTSDIKTIRISVWKDLNNNSVIDSDEPQFETKRTICFYKGI